MFRLYLSGSMQGRYTIPVKAERSLAVHALAKVGIHGIDPAAAEHKLWKPGADTRIQWATPRKIMKAMVIQDKWLIRRSDALLVLTGDSASDGTWREMCFAEQIGIPVILIAPKRTSEELMGWSTIEVPKDHIVPDLQAAIRLIKRKYLKDYEEHRSYFYAAIKNARTYVNSKRNKKKRQQVLRGRSNRRFIKQKINRGTIFRRYDRVDSD